MVEKSVTRSGLRYPAVNRITLAVTPFATATVGLTSRIDNN
jgi:hypothetical protein